MFYRVIAIYKTSLWTEFHSSSEWLQWIGELVDVSIVNYGRRGHGII